MSGDVTYNGRDFSEFLPQTAAVYIEQEDQHLPELTVWLQADTTCDLQLSHQRRFVKTFLPQVDGRWMTVFNTHRCGRPSTSQRARRASARSKVCMHPILWNHIPAASGVYGLQGFQLQQLTPGGTCCSRDRGDPAAREGERYRAQLGHQRVSSGAHPLAFTRCL